MTNITILQAANLTLFDGEGAADLGGGQAQSLETNQGGQTGEGLENVRYGIQPEEAPDAGEPEVQTTSDTLEDRRQRYRDTVNSEEFKELYAEDVQRIIGKKVAQNRGLQEQLDAVRPVVDSMLQRYGIEDGDMDALMDAIEADDGFWERAADDRGMSVDQYKEFSKIQRQLMAANEELRRVQAREGQAKADRQLQQWWQAGEELKQIYPSFDLERESQNPQFLSLLRAGTNLRTAFEVIHMDEIMQGVAANTAAAAERQITGNIRARGQRPRENGAGSTASFTVKSDVNKLSKQDREEIERRVLKGEKISF